ncbi:conserved hypothetical protein, partial [Escherichia coli M605]
PVAEQRHGLRSLPGSYPADSQKNQGSTGRRRLRHPALSR